MSADIPPKAFAKPSALQMSNSICEYCLQPANRLSRCSSCRRVSYCGSACQKKDWKIHKPLCNQLQKLNEIEKDLTPASGRMTRNEYALSMRVRKSLLTNASFGNEYADPRFEAAVQDGIKCEACYLTPFQKPTFSLFRACSRCELAFWCSEDCKTKFDEAHDRTQCDALYQAHCTQRLEIDYSMKRKSPREIMLPTPVTRTPYLPVTSISGWDEYLKRFDGDFDQSVQGLAAEFRANNKDSKLAVSILAKEAMVVPLTIASALVHAYDDISTRTSLCIHILGASRRELLGQPMLENILHYFPRLRALKYCFIGPEANAAMAAGQSKACPECRQRGRSRDIVYSQKPYHECAWSRPGSSSKPDLIVGLNTGMCQVAHDDWHKTMDAVLKSGAPAVFSAYSRAEVDLEQDFMRELGAKVIRDVQDNPWKGVVNTPNVYYEEQYLEGGPHTTTYNSHYTYMIKGRRA